MADSGLLLIDKPAGWTSAQVVRVTKSCLGKVKVGHAGTLDPPATGLLIVGIGEGTKALHYLAGQSKCYEACVALGVKTATGDVQGEVIETRRYERPDEKRIENLLRRFVGEIQQLPPMYSAVRVGGKRLYELARKGRTVERTLRSVTIHSLTLSRCLADGFCFEVHCSKGTYVRTLAEDMGAEFGTVAHLSSLRRTRSGAFSVDDAVEVRTLDACRCDSAKLLRRLLPVDAGLMHLPAVELDPAQSRRMREGGRIATHDLSKDTFCAEGDLYRVYDAEGLLLAVATGDAGYLCPKRVFNKQANGARLR